MTKVGNYLPEVREQYEQFPYPERNPHDECKRLIVSHMTRVDRVNHHCFRGRENFDKGFRVLIAGGGTGDALIAWAEQLRDKPKAQIAYLDMSTASTKIARQRADIRKLRNIRWIEDSILNLPEMNLEKFDFIDCSGVLHHLEDPDAGLNALRMVLKPAGAMSLMVYAPYGRTGIYQVQNLLRMIHEGPEPASEKIHNTHEILRCLPEAHWFRAGQKILGAYDDLESDAGTFDLFLHPRDRAYSILEVHEMLERCGMKMAGEPGTYYRQTHYLPETFLKEGRLLQKVRQYPLRKQQAIAEALSGQISKHEFYAVHEAAGDPIASLTDNEMIPWAGIGHAVPFREVANLAENRKDAFTVTMNQFPNKPRISIPAGNFIASLLGAIDGVRTVNEIVEVVREKHAGASVEAIMMDFESLMRDLGRGHALYLRHASVRPFKPLYKMTSASY